MEFISNVDLYGWQETIYYIGLVVAAIFVLLGLDDLVWDFLSIFLRKPSAKIPLKDLDAKPPKLIALMIAAWKEDAVIEQVIDHLVATAQYPRSMYHIFLGVYPNDDPTIQAAYRLAEKYPHLHVVINHAPGPTSKADNLNNILKHIAAFEIDHNWEFASVTVHDSEDVVHPYEFKLTNYLMDSHEVLQFPVFPLQPFPRLGNIFSTMTLGTYSDEFAENHYRIMSVRDRTGAFVPSAGTGFVLSKNVIRKYQGQELFPEHSLTEDYKLSLTFAQDGIKTHYVLEKVPRVNQHGHYVWEYISTRSRFPDTFRAAVRQKTRWIYGITMQSFALKDIRKSKGLTRTGRYFMYKDLKAKIGNLAILPGYLVFLYFLTSLFFPIPVMYPRGSFSWTLCLILTGMMLERQMLRGIAVRHVYGWRSAFIACLFPPLMPFRWVWGNVLNMTATLRAWKQKIFGSGRAKAKTRKPAWNKTDHEFIEQAALNRFYRNIGDVLLEKQYITSKTLRLALQIAKLEKKKLGDVLIKRGWVEEEQVMRALAFVQHTVFLPCGADLINQEFRRYFERKFLERFRILPVLKMAGGFVMAFTQDSPAEGKRVLEEKWGLKIIPVYTTRAAVDEGLPILYGERDDTYRCRIICGLHGGKMITSEQAVLALAYRHLYANEKELLQQMGLYREDILGDEYTCSLSMGEKEKKGILTILSIGKNWVRNFWNRKNSKEK